MKFLLFALALVPTLLFGQSRKQRKSIEAQRKADQQMISNLRVHIHNLAVVDSSNHGSRNTFSYISNLFQTIGLHPGNDTDYVQIARLNYGKRPDSTTFLKVNGNLLEPGKDYYPLSYSASATVSGMPAMALREKGVPWFTDIKDWLEDNATAGSNLNQLLHNKASEVAAKGATALFVYSTGSATEEPGFDEMDTSAAAALPVIFITRVAYDKYFSDQLQVLDIELNVALKEQKEEATSVIGYVNNSAASTVVITSYYNQLSVGQNKFNTKTKSTPQPVKDNTGTALLIELAKTMSISNAKSNNYLFVVSNCPGLPCIEDMILTKKIPVSYLLCLACPSSYGEEKKANVTGLPTFPSWSQLLLPATGDTLQLLIDSSTQFIDNADSLFRKNIAVLTFSAPGSINPADTAMLDYENILKIEKTINRFIQAADNKGKLAVSKGPTSAEVTVQPEKTKADVRQNNSSTLQAPVAKTFVSLGVIADKNSNPDGLRIKGVSPKKIAEKLGLQPGDILTNLGGHTIENMQTYLLALSAFKPGDKTTLHIKRGKEDKNFAVEF